MYGAVDCNPNHPHRQSRLQGIPHFITFRRFRFYNCLLQHVTRPEDLTKYDVVLTTYSVIEAGG